MSFKKNVAKFARLKFAGILSKSCRNFWNFHENAENPSNLQMSMNSKECRTKPGKKIRKGQAARPLAGADFLVAVGGPSPGERGEEKNVCHFHGGFF